MNKKIFLITATLAAGLWVGCNKAGKLDQASTFKPPSGPVELKVKWPMGERVVQSFSLKQSSEVTVPNQPNPIQQDITLVQQYGLTVQKENPDGSHEVEMEFLGVQMTMTMNGKSMVNFDSAKKSEAKADPMASMFEKVVGAKIHYFLDASNHVDRVEGIDALLSRIGSSGGPVDPSTSLKSMFSESYFKQIMDSSRYLPSKPVQPGDTWPVKMEFEAAPLGTLELDYTVAFQSWEQHGKRTCARLEVQGTIKSEGDSNAKVAGMSVSLSDGTTAGVSWFDPELGMIIDSTANQDMKINMVMPARSRTPNAKPQTITSITKQEISLKLESVK